MTLSTRLGNFSIRSGCTNQEFRTVCRTTGYQVDSRCENPVQIVRAVSPVAAAKAERLFSVSESGPRLSMIDDRDF